MKSVAREDRLGGRIILENASSFGPLDSQIVGFVLKFHVRSLQIGGFVFKFCMSGAEEAFLLVGAVAEAHTQVVAAPLAVSGAVGVLTAEGFQLIHRVVQWLAGKKKSGHAAAISLENSRSLGKPDRTPPLFGVSVILRCV